MNWQDLLSQKTISALCAQYGFRPSKEYGQNYLISAAPIEKILEAGGVTNETTVVEVGAGFGVLTLAAAQRVKNVFSFEIEQTLREYWEDQQKDYPNVHIIWGNAMTQFAKTIDIISTPYIVLANVPYQITSQLIRLFLEADPQPKRIIMMVQKEVAERICAKPGEMSLLSVSVQLYGAPKIITGVKKGNFWPVPKVDSAVLAIDSVHTPKDAKKIMTIAKAGFAQKRKQLWRNIARGLSVDKDIVQAAIKHIGHKPTVRAQELSVQDWQVLTKQLNT